MTQSLDLPIFALVVPSDERKLVHLGSAADDARDALEELVDHPIHARVDIGTGVVMHMVANQSARNPRAERLFHCITDRHMSVTGPVVFNGLSIRQIQDYMSAMFSAVRNAD